MSQATRKKIMDYSTLAFSVAAIVISVVTIYFQFFRVAPELSVAMHIDRGDWIGQGNKLKPIMNITFVNAGNQPVLVQEIFLELLSQLHPSSKCDQLGIDTQILTWRQYSDGENAFQKPRPIVVKPEEIFSGDVDFGAVDDNLNDAEFLTGCLYVRYLAAGRPGAVAPVWAFCIVHSPGTIDDLAQVREQMKASEMSTASQPGHPETGMINDEALRPIL